MTDRISSAWPASDSQSVAQAGETCKHLPMSADRKGQVAQARSARPPAPIPIPIPFLIPHAGRHARQNLGPIARWGGVGQQPGDTTMLTTGDGCADDKCHHHQGWGYHPPICVVSDTRSFSSAARGTAQCISSLR